MVNRTTVCAFFVGMQFILNRSSETGNVKLY